MKHFTLAAGRLRHRVHIQSRVDSQNPLTGANEHTWTNDYSDVPCSIEPVSVREFLQSKTDQSEVSARVIMRKIQGYNYNSSLRLIGACGCHEGKIYNPQGWLEDQASGQEYITSPCTQGTNQGA